MYSCPVRHGLPQRLFAGFNSFRGLPLSCRLMLLPSHLLFFCHLGTGVLGVLSEHRGTAGHFDLAAKIPVTAFHARFQTLKPIRVNRPGPYMSHSQQVCFYVACHCDKLKLRLSLAVYGVITLPL